MSANLIGTRLKALREQQNLSQDEVARVFGFKDRQTVSAIETGERRLSAEELLTAVEKLGATLDYFTDPFLLAGEGKLSWRVSNMRIARLDTFEHAAGRWIAAWRRLAPQVGKPVPNLRQALRLTSRSTFEDAMAAGERLAADFALGPVPARCLAEAMEERLGILVLMVDTIKGVSSGVCRLPDLDAVLINRREMAGRRHFELTHALFRLLTWDAMPPEQVEQATEYGWSRIGQLADRFASAVLMPATSLEGFGAVPADAVRWLNATADALEVPATALRRRLVALGWLDQTRAKAVPDNALRNNSHKKVRGEAPPLFSKTFMEVITLAIGRGHVSTRRAAGVLDLTIEDLADLCRTYGIAAGVGL
jgi:transcriptional regulator with XRE-family HTH domain/Zn-dependent peptidase ImmA (M78 family)